MIKVAVVILNYNGEKYLNEFLPSVIKNTENAQIIVADNYSIDNSVELVLSKFPTVELITLPKNFGFAGGYNEALKKIKATYFVLLNSDVEVSPNWLNPLTNFLDKHTTYAACQPKIRDYTNQSKFEYAGASGGFIDSLGYPYCRGRIFDEIENDTGQYNDAVDIFWSSGACMMIRSSIFFEIGGFDNDFFAHMEEIDLCWRIQSAGFKIRCTPKSIIYHVGGGTLDKSSSFKTYLNFRNGLYLLLKNLPIHKLFVKLPFRLFLDWVAAAKFLLDGNSKHTWAIIKAHSDFYWNFLKTYRKRKKTSNTPNSKLLVLHFYLRKKKKFNML